MQFLCAWPSMVDWACTTFLTNRYPDKLESVQFLELQNGNNLVSVLLAVFYKAEIVIQLRSNVISGLPGSAPERFNSIGECADVVQQEFESIPAVAALLISLIDASSRCSSAKFRLWLQYQPPESPPSDKDT